MIKVINLRIRDTKSYWHARVTARNQFKTATGSRQVPRSEPFALTKAVNWAQENAINQLKKEFV